MHYYIKIAGRCYHLFNVVGLGLAQSDHIRLPTFFTWIIISMTLGTNYVMSFKLTAFLFILISAQLFIDSKALNEKHFINFQ